MLNYVIIYILYFHCIFSFQGKDQYFRVTICPDIKFNEVFILFYLLLCYAIKTFQK